MARAIRIDAVTPLPNGRVQILYSEGQAPLSLAPMGLGIEIDRQVLVSKVLEARDEFNDQMMLFLLLGFWHQRDGGWTNVSNIIGRTLILDMSLPRNVLQVI